MKPANVTSCDCNRFDMQNLLGKQDADAGSVKQKHHSSMSKCKQGCQSILRTMFFYLNEYICMCLSFVEKCLGFHSNTLKSLSKSFTAWQQNCLKYKICFKFGLNGEEINFLNFKASSISMLHMPL